jgi:hypothetical protein
MSWEPKKNIHHESTPVKRKQRFNRAGERWNAQRRRSRSASACAAYAPREHEKERLIFLFYFVISYFRVFVIGLYF